MSDSTKENIPLTGSYDSVRDYLSTHKSVDMITGGGDPATFRWLTSKNKYINIGLEKTGNSALLKVNENSYGVSQEELQEVAKDVNAHFAK